VNRAQEIARNIAAMIPKDAKGIVMIAIPKSDGEGYIVAAITNLPDEDCAGILLKAHERMKNGEFTDADAEVNASRS
jgi:hypothetical protein